MGKKICIVTSDIKQSKKNSEFSNHVYSLCKELAKANYDMTILYIGNQNKMKNIYQSKYHKVPNIKFVYLDELEQPNYYLYKEWFIVRANIIYKYLKKKSFDYIHFKDLQANALHTIQAKRNSKEFENTFITVTMHSPTQWLNEGMVKRNEWDFSNSMLEWCERYCCENCDLLISPSDYMFNWAIKRGWHLSKNRMVIPYCIESEKGTRGKWLKLHDQNIKYSDIKVINKIENEEIQVSICIAYYNYGKYLPQLLKSISKSKYKNYQVIVVNDGSTEEESNRVFGEMKKVYNKCNWHFIEKENGGTGEARNFGAKYSSGEYIIFMDADNIATPNMIKDFLYGICKSKADCLTCHLNAFMGDETVHGGTKIAYKYMPIGPALEVGFIQNIFGDANFIVKRDVFFHIGGFIEDRNATWEDWVFLVRLNLLGYKQEVLPEPLFWYRHHNESFSRNSNYFKNLDNVIKEYRNNNSFFVGNLITSLAIPFSNKYNEILNDNHLKRNRIKKLMK
ncbi:MAG: glycosyltransferase [Maledivibacter sp.]|jgi:glycosyltransferase involved in cell wall biosynthesis|nr:glycosyltransferase [Maledivibacter sp.]